jgi:hypothetical protein
MTYLPLVFETYRAVVQATIAAPLAVKQLRAGGRRSVGPVQALFLAWCAKDKLRMEQQEFGKAMAAYFKSAKSAALSIRPFYWRGYSRDLLRWLGLDEPIKPSHIELVYSKVKRSIAHGISYLEFVRSLALLRQENPQQQQQQQQQQPIAHNEDGSYQPLLDETAEGGEEDSDVEGGAHLEELDPTEQEEATRVALWVLLRQDPAILHLAAISSPGQAKAAQPWLQAAHHALVAQALERLGKAVVPLQSLIRSRLARKVLLHKKHLRYV